MRIRIIPAATLLIVLVLSVTFARSQTPQGFSYQAVVRDGNGTPIANRNVSIKISLQSSTGTVFYSESKTLTSNLQGVINHTVGSGTPISGTFSSVPWSSGDVYLNVEIDPNGGTTYTQMGTPSKLQSVPYALFAENTKEVVSGSTATDDDPIFVVKNKLGQIVFAVYQTGVRVYVEDSQLKGVRGGFAIGGLTNQSKNQQEYFRITPDSARIYVKEVPSAKGVRGGFAIGGLTNQSKTVTAQDLMFVAPDSTRVYVLNNTKGVRGGFAIGGLTNQSKSATGNFLGITPENSFIGQEAGKSNNTGIRNTFIGYQAGYGNIGGYDNIFMGNESGYYNTDGTNNIFLGTRSGKNNTSGQRNIFLGISSGEKNTTGLQNIGIGEQAGYNLLTGSMNVFIGTVAGYNNTTGKANVFIGNFAGNQNTGNRNVAIGNLAGGYQNNVGSNNVFIGHLTGYMNAGSSNVFLGEQSGSNNIEGSGNVFIGSNAGANELGSNKLYIANSNTTTPLIYGEFDGRKLDLNGSVNLKDLLNLKPRTSYPGNPKIGDVFYDGNSNVIKYYDGTKWMALSATASVSTATVSTISVPPISILGTSCTVNCNISADGGSSITEQGVYYSTIPFYDTESNPKKTYLTPGVGDFSVSLTSLQQNSSYYVRAYATNSGGTSLGNMLVFTTPSLSSRPSVTTSNVLSISQTAAIGGGNVILPGGKTLTSVGVCWSTSINPTLNNNFTTATVGLGSFSCNLTGLIAGTTYYVRAFASNTNGTGYGNQVVFTTEPAVNTVTDIDGNTYNIVQIGTQTWMKENLKTTKYRDGSSIANVVDDASWMSQTNGAYCWYNNDETANKNIYGALYNYYAVIDSRNLCPSGWHVSTKDDWATLSSYLGGDKIAGGKLKEIGTAHWMTPNTGADNLSGLTVLPGGSRYGTTGAFNDDITTFGWFWSYTGSELGFEKVYCLFYGSSELNYYTGERGDGMSVRCLKDQ